MTQPELPISYQEMQLEDTLAGKDPSSVFYAPGEFLNARMVCYSSEGSLCGQLYWRAYQHPEQFALHRYSTDDGSKVEFIEVPILDGDDKQGWVPEMFKIGEPRPLPQGSSTEYSELKYRGRVSREEAIDGALSWLEQHGNDEKIPPESDVDSIEIAELLDTGNGPVFVTRIGALIFDHHIHAMQDRGATYRESSGE